MTNERMYTELRDDIEKEAKKDIVTVRSWRNVGKNYATKKDGKPFADPVKSFQGVDGITKAYRGKSWCGDSFVKLVNTEGQEMDVTGLTLPQIEDKIAQTIKKAENDYRFRMNLINRFSEICEQCDSALTAVFATLPDNPELNSIYAAKNYFEKYVGDTIREEVFHRVNAVLAKAEKSEQKTA